MPLTYKGAVARMRAMGFYLIRHMVVIHHLRKDFIDFDIIRDRYYILPVGRDYLHVAIIENDVGRAENEVQVRYTCAGDDLLYGLRVKFKSGGATDPQDDIDAIAALIQKGSLRDHPRYVRARFRHGRFQAKLRALLIFLKDKWQSLFLR